MAAPLLLFYCLLTAAALNPDVSPHITGCVSANMETFRCRWNPGPFQSGQLRLFYINKHPHSPPREWTECPHYSTQRPNECFFNENHTTVWTFYTIQLRSRDESITYDQKVLDVADIVQPDPPLEPTWTLLNQSVTSLYSDIMLSWRPPESADVETGWLRLQYEVQYRKVDAVQWQVADLVTSTYRTLYGLETDVDYEVRVRCRMLAAKAFGDFSDSVVVHIPSNGSHFPAAALLILGALCVVAVLMLVAILQQEKLTVLLLPPVPGPKIRGIDSELLKKGKLRELTSILGSPLDLRPELYHHEPWVEPIHLDIEEASHRLTDVKPDWLLKASLASSCSPATVSFRAEDSGQASCCQPGLSSEAEESVLHPPTLRPANDQTTGCQLRAPGPSGREASYTQVSEVRSNNKLLLSPELEQSSSKDVSSQKEGEDPHASVVNPGHDHQMAAPKGPTFPTRDASGSDVTCPSRSHDHDSAPAPIYTLVDSVARRNSLVLTPNASPGLQLTIPKNTPTPSGYLTPDLLGSITP